MIECYFQRKETIMKKTNVFKSLFVGLSVLTSLSLVVSCSPKTDIEPVQPEDPTDPVDPEDPTDPEDPVDPEDPTDPTDPGEPDLSVKGVTLNEHTLNLTVEESASLVAVINPENAENTDVTWSSSNDEIATVSSRGVVTATGVGTATITVTTVDGGFTDQCVVNVEQGTITVTGVSLNYETVSSYVEESLTLNATVEPYNATNQELTWSSSDEAVATVTNGVVATLSVGTATITVTTVDGGYTASCVFTVSEKPNEDQYEPEVVDGIYKITAGGEYALSGDQYKQVFVDVDSESDNSEVILNLNGVTIENSDNSPIYVKNCGSIDISAKKGTVNNIIDERPIYTKDDETQGTGAIYVANGDLKLKGTGTLNITAGYYNGIHGKDDVKVQKQTLNITAVHHGIKGNDSVTITSGTVNISCGGDGIRTENSDISSKGNQRGNITIQSGEVTINSWGDAIAASYNAVIEESTDGAPTLVAKTNKYSSYTGETVETSESVFYIKMSSSTYSNGNYTYAAYINNAWYRATYKGTQTSSQGGQGGGWGGGGSSTYYVYEIAKPSDATSFKLYRFSGSNVTSFSTSSYNATSDAKAFNSAYDTVQISIRSGKISFGNWSNYSSNGTSAKGIKAENEVIISAGTIDINAYDDGIHANSDASLENGQSPLGNVSISGGDITISSSDDGIHADYTLEISGGNVNVTTSYEGLEGNLIKISGGSSNVFATDDGVNAASGKSSPNITISGGLLDVAVPSSGDTDGVDSNGTFTQTGGVAIIKGPGTAGTNAFGAAALDTESTVKITSGTLIVFGGIEQTPSSSVTRTLCTSNTISSGNHTVSFTNESFTTNLKYSYRGCIVYSSLGSAKLS